MTKFVFCHHAERADRYPVREKSEKYPEITKKGEKQTQEKAKILAQMIHGLSDSSVVVLGGCSKAVRTASTLAVFTDELRRIFQDKKDVIFSRAFNPESPLDALKEISMHHMGNGNKVIVDFPLPIEEFMALRGQKEIAVARRMINGLSGEEGFFRRFFLEKFMILMNISHASEMEALANFLAKENGSVHIGGKVSFHFM